MTIPEQIKEIKAEVEEIKNMITALTNTINGLVDNQRFVEEVSQSRFTQIIKRVEDKTEEIKSKINQLS